MFVNIASPKGLKHPLGEEEKLMNVMFLFLWEKMNTEK